MKLTPTSFKIGNPDGTWVDMSHYVSAVEIDQVRTDDAEVVYLNILPSFTVSTKIRLTPFTYRLIFGHRAPWISRMHRRYHVRQLARRRRR